MVDKSVTKEAKVIVKHSMIYGMATVLNRIVGFVMLPVYTRFLTPSDYGTMELIYTTTSMIAMIVGIGIESAVARFYFDYDADVERKKVVSTALIGYGSCAAGVILLLLPFSGLSADLVLDQPGQTSLFIVAFISLGFEMILPVIYAYLRVQQKSFQYVVTRVLMTISSLGLNIYFVVFAGKGVYGIFLSNLITNMLFAIIMSYMTLRQSGFGVDYGLMKNMIKFGLPLIPSNISAYIVQASDRYFVKHYGDLSITGLYSLGYKFGTLTHQFVTSPFIQIWSPRRMEYFGKEGYEKIYARIFTYFCAASLFIGLMISLLAKEIIHFMATEAYWDAYKIVPIVTLAYIIFSFHYHFNVGIMMAKATKYIAYVNIQNGVLNILLNFLLIGSFGIWGAAGATLICFIFKAAIIHYYSNRLYKIDMEWRRVLILFGVAVGIYFISLLINTGSIYIDFMIKVFVGLSYPMSLFLFGFFTSDEVKRMKHFIKTRRFEFNKG